MKNVLIIFASLLFSTLFFKQNIGLNLTLFSFITIIILAITHPKKASRKVNLAYIIIYLLTAIFVFLHKSNLSVITNIIVFFTIIGSFSESKSSIYVKWLNGLYSLIAGFFHRNFDVKNKEEKVALKKEIDVWHWVKLIGVPLITIILFTVLYKNGNPVFNDLISKINLKFINLQWILFTLLGYYLLCNIVNPVQVNPATQNDLQTENNLMVSGNFSEEKLKKEKQLGTTLLVLLNVLIAFYLITDILYLLSEKSFNAVLFSQQVHNGINALIASIAVAIIIILYFFRGNLNFYNTNKTLKNLSYLWIFLNVILIIFITIKNNLYVTSFGFTYKRIGVYIYLLLTLMGLITTFLKVYKVKNLWYLFRINTQIAFGILFLFSVVNWDNTITKYNINYAKNLDLSYLINLSNNNAIELNNYKNANQLSSSLHNKIEIKYRNYLSQLSTNNWQEWSYDNFNKKLLN